jgi:hypothetical protein
VNSKKKASSRTSGALQSVQGSGSSGTGGCHLLMQR